MDPLVASVSNNPAHVCIRIQSPGLPVLSTLNLFRAGVGSVSSRTGEHMWFASRNVVVLTDSGMLEMSE